jgi:hypothetical protein
MMNEYEGIDARDMSFSQLKDAFDQVIGDDEDTLFDIIFFVLSIPKFKLFVFYISTFRMVDGKKYRQAIGYAKLPYYIRYRLYLRHISHYLWSNI